MPLDLVGPTPGRILRVLVRDPFFSGILIHFIRFDVSVLQGFSIQIGSRMGLKFMSKIQEMPSATGEFPSQLGGGHPLGKAAQDEDHLRGPPVGPLEEGARPGIEDPAAVSAAIIEDGFTIKVLDAKPVSGLTAGAVQALGMKEVEKELIAGIFIHQVVDGEIHRVVSSGSGCFPSRMVRDDLRKSMSKITDLGP
jgi:hypothetical protein